MVFFGMILIWIVYALIVPVLLAVFFWIFIHISVLLKTPDVLGMAGAKIVSAYRAMIG